MIRLFAIIGILTLFSGCSAETPAIPTTTVISRPTVTPLGKQSVYAVSTPIIITTKARTPLPTATVTATTTATETATPLKLPTARNSLTPTPLSTATLVAPTATTIENTPTLTSQPGNVTTEIDVWAGIGPEGGIIVALAIDPATPTTLYAGSYGGRVFKSIDGGKSWNAAATGLTRHTVTSLAIDPTTPTTLYAGTQGGGVFKRSTAVRAGVRPALA
jgi:hypothetical protein